MPWLRQCYLGVLPWPEVCRYAALAVCLGPDYLLYFTVSVLRHLQPGLVRAAGRPLPLLAIKVRHSSGAHRTGRRRRHRTADRQLPTRADALAMISCS